MHSGNVYVHIVTGFIELIILRRRGVIIIALLNMHVSTAVKLQQPTMDTRPNMRHKLASTPAYFKAP
jgi:hypothetical protein